MQPTLPLLRRLSIAGEKLIPGALTFFLLLLGAIPKRFLLIADFAPLLGVIGIYYWGLFKPRLMPYWLVFLFGLLQDVLFNLPLGLSPLLLLLLRLTVASQRRAFTRETFLTLWFGFAVLSTAFSVAAWVMVSLWDGVAMPFEAPLLQWLVTVICYPPLHRFFNAIYTRISKPLA